MPERTTLLFALAVSSALWLSDASGQDEVKPAESDSTASPEGSSEASEAAASKSGGQNGTGSWSVRPPGPSALLRPAEGDPFFVNQPRFTEQGIRSGDRTFAWDDLRGADLFPKDTYDTDGSLIALEVGGVGSRETDETTIKFDRGMHWFHVGYVHLPGETVEFDVQIKGPALPNWQSIPPAMIYGARDSVVKREEFSAGFDSDGHRLPEKVKSIKSGTGMRTHSVARDGRLPTRIEDIRDMPLVGYSAMRSFSDLEGNVGEAFAVYANGLLRIPKKGEYQLRVKTSGMARVQFGDWTPGMGDRTPTEDDAGWQFLLAGDGELHGNLKAIDGESIICDYLAGPISQRKSKPFPLARGYVTELWRAGFANGRGIDRPETEDGEDVVYAVGSGSAVRGVPGELIRMDGDKLVFAFRGQERTIAMDKVRGISLGIDAKPPGQPGDRWLAVRLIGGGRVPCKALEGNLGSLQLVLPGGTSAEVQVEEAMSVEVIGGRVISLTDLPPAEIRRIPLFDLPPAVTKNRQPDGDPLLLRGRSVVAGWCLTSRSEVRFDLSGRFSRFRGEVGLLDGATGPCDIRAAVDGRPLLEIAGADATTFREFDLPIDGGDSLTLEVDFHDGLDAGDVVVWSRPELIRDASSAGAATAGD